ncbi:Insulin-like growth factor binding protein, N-terminal [Pseudocohnilembus persalinus]|uniref:Insulin-like growth factor binding protein, N-terminal n=1 Tax=Pseudocohnilembus persalinus TaxID=266149 RepID=A0A0V0QJM0_PSEPJ|nr:Insulin-like growth factor binding protein, N-terminal [Pseudocohnilembus persalinus]|eukprot:KRX02402.1 Insulin-like growth factor binding protein, N-terminal [Pseudocohnilembus persalinus]
MKTNLIAYLFLSLILFLSQHQIKSTRVETINITSQESFCLEIDSLLKIKDLKEVERFYVFGSEKGINSLQCLEKLNGKTAFKFIEIKLDRNQIDDLSYLADFIKNSKCNTCEVQNCLKCSEKDKCDECMVLFSLQNDQHDCVFCSANCKTCNSIIECKECDGDYKIFTKVVGKQIQYTCIAECPPTHIVVDNKYCELKDCGEGKYLQDDGSCKDCIKNCSKCLGPKNEQCVQCNLNYEFSDDRECVKIYKGPSGTLIAILIILIVLFAVLIGFVLWRYFRYRQTIAKKKQFSTQFIDEYEESEQVSFKSNDSK